MDQLNVAGVVEEGWLTAWCLYAEKQQHQTYK